MSNSKLFVIPCKTLSKIVNPGSMFSLNIARNLLIKQNIFGNLN